MDLRWAPEEDIAMSVDCGEEEWRRLHDIRQATYFLQVYKLAFIAVSRLNGQMLEYCGRGKSLIDVGLAQAKTALCTR